MRIHVDDPSHVESLLSFLRERVHIVAAQVGDDEIAVSQLGSMDEEGRRLELDLLLRLWLARHPDATASIVPY